MESLKNGKYILESPWIFSPKKSTNPVVHNNVTLRIYFSNLFIDSSKHFEFNVFSAWRPKLYHQNGATQNYNKREQVPTRWGFLSHQMCKEISSLRNRWWAQGRQWSTRICRKLNVWLVFSEKVREKRKRKTKLRLYENLWLRTFQTVFGPLFSSQSSKKYPYCIIFC